MVRRTAETVFIPLTVGGGVQPRSTTSTSCCAPARTRSRSTPGRSAEPEVIGEITRRFGNQVLVLSVDARRAEPGAVRLRGDHPRRAESAGWTRSSGLVAASSRAWARSC